MRVLAPRMLLALLAGGIATVATGATATSAGQHELDMDCAHVSAADVAQRLASVPAPRIILFQGSLTTTTMQSFGEFLIAMGYPEERVRNPRDGGLSQSSFGDSLPWAGMLAWYYENEGMVPVLVGHSQGGMMAIRILHELDGAFHDDITVRDPRSGETLARTTIRDPVNGATRPVRGLKVDYAAAIATGKLPRIFLGQWDMISKLRRIPDTAIDFTGFSIPWDPIAGTFGDPEPYAATGTAHVRNVLLASSTSHVGVPETVHLAGNAVTRAWIDAYSPDNIAPLPIVDGIDTANLLHAADIWFSVKQNWCRSAQQRLRAGVIH